MIHRRRGLLEVSNSSGSIVHATETNTTANDRNREDMQSEVE